MQGGHQLQYWITLSTLRELGKNILPYSEGKYFRNFIFKTPLQNKAIIKKSSMKQSALEKSYAIIIWGKASENVHSE